MPGELGMAVKSLRQCGLVVGMHADQATEAVVDFALTHGKPFAVVPCCVFPNAFPQRRLPGGAPVRTTAELDDGAAADEGALRRRWLARRRRTASHRAAPALAPASPSSAPHGKLAEGDHRCAPHPLESR